MTRNRDSIPEATMNVIADTLARLVGIVCCTAADDQPEAIRAGRLVAAKQCIARRLADPDLCPADVAEQLAISVRALHLLFEPTGIGFIRYVQSRRLEECRMALLAHTDRPVTEIAFAWGFSSFSGFYRAFRGAFGMSPNELCIAARCVDYGLS
jgi:AraC-like DNA-binding protein